MGKKPIVEEKIIVSIVIFAHGGETYAEPLQEPYASFYTNNVRVFSKACVPGVPSCSAASEHTREVADLITECQSNKDKSTNELFDNYMQGMKSYYMAHVTSKVITEMFPRTSLHPDKTCGTMTFLSPKTFFLRANPGEQSYAAEDAYGIFLVDVRKQITYDDGTVEYELLLKPGRVTRDSAKYWNIMTDDGMETLLHKVGRNKPKKKPTKKAVKEAIASHFTDNTITLQQMYELFAPLGIDYVNIIDNSCRSSLSGTLTSRERLLLHEREQSAKTSRPFGGKKQKRTRVVRRTKNRKTIKKEIRN